jgi:HEAT repeat protein
MAELEVLANDEVIDELIEIATDRRYGPARQMVVLGLARPKDERVVGPLIELLNDDEVAGHAAMALGKLRARAAREPLEQLVKRPTADWIHTAAQRSLTRIDR